MEGAGVPTSIFQQTAKFAGWTGLVSFVLVVFFFLISGHGAMVQAFWVGILNKNTVLVL